MIDKLTTQFGDNKAVGIAYVYCNFRRSYEQKAEDLIISLLKQLAQGQPSLPENVKLLYDKHNKPNKPRTWPLFTEISGAIQSVAIMYSQVFLIIDALDECQTSDGCRSKFLTEIFNLNAKCGANIFATSRFILEVITKFDRSMSLEICASMGDIQMYLEGNMSQLTAFEDWDDQLRDEIKTSISNAVDGMCVSG